MLLLVGLSFWSHQKITLFGAFEGVYSFRFMCMFVSFSLFSVPFLAWSSYSFRQFCCSLFAWSLFVYGQSSCSYFHICTLWFAKVYSQRICTRMCTLWFPRPPTVVYICMDLLLLLIDAWKLIDPCLQRALSRLSLCLCWWFASWCSFWTNRSRMCPVFFLSY